MPHFMLFKAIGIYLFFHFFVNLDSKCFAFIVNLDSKCFAFIVNQTGESKCHYVALTFLQFGYIIPPMPAPAGIAGASSLIFATTLSVVRKVLATLVAF